MQISKTQVTKLRLTELDSLDPVEVIVDDLGPEQGKITITCFGKSWTAYWGAMGQGGLAKFFCRCDEEYLVDNLSSIQRRIVDYEKISKDIGVEVVHETLMTEETAVADVYGNDWRFDLPQTENPEYAYLCRIIHATKDGLKANVDKVKAAA